MKKVFLRSIAFFKGLILLFRPHVYLGWLRHPLLSFSNTLALSRWIARQDKSVVLNDFYTTKRDYSRRYKLYEALVSSQNLGNQKVDYLEFGVCGAHSFRWWLAANKNADSRFYGFDTFEGLPEKWGTFSKGDMAAAVPEVGDLRAKFVKGLFQDSVPPFLAQHVLRSDARKIIHLDADLFSSTLYALTSLAPYLKKGDILLFDEFNVPNHEFFAYRIFTDSFYVKTRLLAAVNNYYQVAMIIE